MLCFKSLFPRLLAVGVVLLSSVLLTASPATVGAQSPNQTDNANATQAVIGTAFTYQGRLTDNGAPANGKYDFIFALYDGETGGTQIGGNLPKDDIEVKDGFFTVSLDFGNVFDGARYLEIGVRPGVSTDSYTPLSPRRVITPSPYALALPGVVVRNGKVGIGTADPQAERQ